MATTHQIGKYPVEAELGRVGEKVRILGWNGPGDAYDAACALSLCIPIVQKNENADQDQREKQSSYYAGEAIAMLRDAVAKGFDNVCSNFKLGKFLDACKP